LKRFTGLDIDSNDSLILSSTLFQLVLLFLAVAAVVVFVALPAAKGGTELSDWRTFGVFLVVGGIGYYLVSRRILRRISTEMRKHTQFISDASHELRTPLTIMKTQLEIALRHGDQVNHKEVMADTLQEVNRMHHIVEDLLLLSKNYLNEKSKEKTTTHLNHLLADIVRKLQPYAEKNGVELTLADRSRKAKEIIVKGDPIKLGEAFMNVIRNAIDYSKPGEGGVVNVFLNHTRATDYYVSVKIADNGIGIDAKHLPLLFNRFFQVNKNRALKEGGGSGLGLAITKSIVEHYGGKIELASRPGLGTTVTLFLEWSDRI
jgi:signal transduction histidine kinase